MDIYACDMTMLVLWIIYEALKFDIVSIFFILKGMPKTL